MHLAQDIEPAKIDFGAGGVLYTAHSQSKARNILYLRRVWTANTWVPYSGIELKKGTIYCT